MGKPQESEPGEADAQTIVGRRLRRSHSAAAPRPPAETAGAELDDGLSGATQPLVPESDTGDATIARVVLAEEASRAVGFCATALIMVTLVAVQLPWLGGDPERKRLCTAAMAVMFATSLWGFLRSRRPGGYTRNVFRTVGWVLATCMLAVEHYMGFFSPVTVVLSLGIYYLGQSTDRIHALLLPLYVTLSWAAGSVLIAVGWVADLGLYSTGNVDLATYWVMVTGVACSLLMTQWLAGRARLSVRRAILDSNRALLTARKRSAQLAEAHNQLERAMRAVVGKAGKYTGQSAHNYQLGNVIGVGAMGEVYAAEHLGDRHAAAVKLLHADGLTREDMVQRFLREAAVCKRFEHPSLVRVYDVGRMQDGAPFMAMERLRGRPLSTVLRERSNLSVGEVIVLAQQLGAGLDHAHKRGVIHRDLKPHNIVEERASDGALRWTILDFGISKLLDSTDTITGAGLVGTPAYMSPEQALGLMVDPRSDVFALGSVLYRALTGRPAFPGKETPRIMFDVAYGMPEQPSKQAEGIGPDMDLVLALALAKDPEDRFESALELARALEQAARGRLDGAVRIRARALLAQQPWGSGPSEPSPSWPPS